MCPPSRLLHTEIIKNTILKTNERRIDILERILDTDKTTFDLQPGKTLHQEVIDDEPSLGNKPSWVRAFKK